MKILALDFGGSAVKYCVVDEKANILAEGKEPAPLESKEAYVNTIVKLYEQYKPLDGIGISTPGYINPKTGYIDGAGAYMQMIHTNLYDLLKDKVPVKVAVENDGKSAALAEAWNGALAASNDGVVLVIGSGYAGGIIHDGKVLRGNKHMAGEFSCVGIKPDGTLNDSVVKKGSMSGLILEANMAYGIDINKCEFAPLAPLFGYVQTEDQLGPMNDDLRFEHGIDGPMFFDMLAAGDEKLQPLYEKFMDTIASTLMIVQCVLDPEVVALGGGFIRQERVIPDLQKRIEIYDSILGGGLAPHINLVKCKHSHHANVFGAAYNYIQMYGVN